MVETQNCKAGGKAIYGVSLGILMLQTRFPRIVGDMGNAETWPFPVHYKIVRGATPDKVVRQDPRDLLPDFIAAGEELIAMGVSGITTNCGFLALLQPQLQKALAVPVATSSLLQVPMLQATLPKNQRVGIITISSAGLGEEHLAAMGIVGDTPIIGTAADGEFSQKILNDAHEMDFEQVEKELLEAVVKMRDLYPEVGAVVLECTNMMPYAAAMQQLSGLPVYGMDSLVRWFHSGLRPHRYRGWSR